MQFDQVFPDLLFLRLIVGEYSHSSRPAIVQMNDNHVGARLHLLSFLVGKCSHLLWGDDALGLEAGADDHTLVIDAHYLAGHQVSSAVLPRRKSRLRKLGHVGDVDYVRVLGYHQLSCSLLLLTADWHRPHRSSRYFVLAWITFPTIRLPNNTYTAGKLQPHGMGAVAVRISPSPGRN